MFAADLQIVELAALRGRSSDLRTIAAMHGITLPEMGRAVVTGEDITVCVRPRRWLLISDTGLPAARRLRASSASESEQEALDRRAAEEGIAVAVDLSSALTPFRINDAATCARLAGGCRVDLTSAVFPESSAAATIIAQVQVILVRLPDGLLVLTPSTTARHFKEWLGAHAK